MSEFPEIPGYRIDKLLGKGGMGEVYLALQTSLDRQVALKITLPSLAEMDESFTQRFVIEAKATAALNHPNIITIYDAGVHAQSSYMAMEYISFGTLKDLTIENLSHEDVCQLFIGIARGLGSAHDAGFVHRDIKPDNILIDEKGIPILTDFGIVKTLNQNVALTMVGSTIGTPQYMSPEQIRAHEVDGRSDLYSLGVMLFNLLEGGVPFNDETPSAIYIMHVTAPPPALSDQNKIFQPIITKLLEKSPDDRYKDAKELIIALKKVVRSKKKTNTGFITKPVDLDKTKLNKPIALDTGNKYPSQQSNVLDWKEKTVNNTKLLAGVASILLLVLVVVLYNILGKKPNAGVTNTDEIVSQKATQIPSETKQSNIEDVAEQGDSTSQPDSAISNDISLVSQKEENQSENMSSLDKILSDIKKDSDPSESISSTENDIASTTSNEIDIIDTSANIVTNKLDVNEKTDNLIITNNPTSTIKDTNKIINTTVVQLEPETNDKPVVEKVIEPPNKLEIDELLRSAKEDFNSFKLLRPKGKNAYEKLIKVLELDRENQQAKTQTLEIVYKYLALSNSKANTSNVTDAIKYIDSALLVRQEYLAKGYDAKEFFGVSESIAVANLNSIKTKLVEKRRLNIIETKKREKEQQRLAEIQEQERIKQEQDATSLSFVDEYEKGKEAYESRNYEEALKWFSQSAEKSYALAQDKLGSMYFSGKGVVKNTSRAAEWYLKAANQNLGIAQNHIGLLYFKGIGVKRNFKKAFEWFQKSGNQRVPNAQWMLGLMYENGKGTRKNRKKSFDWYKKAARQGNEQAIEKLKKSGINL